MWSLLFLYFSLLHVVNGQDAFNSCSAGKDNLNPPRCPEGGIDPFTNKACTDYGYDCTWTIKVNTVGTHKRIEVNGVWPPPAIQVAEGERIRIALDNQIGEDVTLHFHGLLQEAGYVLMDGPQHLTQTGVQNNGKFVYDFPATKAGTYWIHSHAPGQYPKGLRSPLVVKKSSDSGTFNYDASSEDFNKLITLSDHWDDFWLAQSRYDQKLCGTGIENPPQNQLFNDRAPSDTASLGRQKILLQPDKKYRLRFVNMSAFARYYIWIDDINMKVIEVDGVMLSPGQVSKGIELASGQRVSVIVSINSSATTKRIMAISDRRIHRGQPRESSWPEFCKLNPTSTMSDMQYTWGWLVNTDGAVNTYSFHPPNSNEMQTYGRWVQSWNEGVQVDPFYKFRPKLPFLDQDRTGVDKTKTCGSSKCTCNTHDNCNWNPICAWDFEEQYLYPTPTMAPLIPTAFTSAYVHEITLNELNGNQGWGVMGLGSSPQQFVAPDRQPTDIPKAASNGEDYDFPYLTTLLRALWYPTYNSNYETPAWYSGSNDQRQEQQAIVMKKDEVHWFALRTLRGDHPIHMHGHEFQIIAKVPVETSSTGDVQSFAGYGHNYTKIAQSVGSNPSRRDTIMVEKGTTVIVAIKANNPGVWALHCHNDFHAESGMFMQLIEDPASLRNQLGTLNWSKGVGGRWNFQLYMTDYASKSTALSYWLYQTVKKSFDYWGYTGLTVKCGNTDCDFSV